MAGEIKTLKENNIQIIPKTKVDAVLNSSEQPIQNDIDNIDGEFQEAKVGLDEICGFTTTDIAEGLEDIQQAKTNIRTAIINKGVEVPFATPFEEYSQKVDQIETEIVNEDPDDPEVISYILRNFTSFENSEVTKLRSNAFYYCSSLAEVSFPVCSSIESYAFTDCYSLTNVSFPMCSNIGARAFYACSSLTSISFPVCSNIGNYAFADCSSLANVYLTSSSMVTLKNSNVFSGCINLQSIYVNSSLVDTYKTDSVWSWYADKIVSI